MFIDQYNKGEKMNKKSTNEENIQEICKYYYDYWQNTKWNTKKLANLVTPELDIKKIRKLAIAYATEYLNMTEDELYTKISKERGNQNGNERVSNACFKIFESLSDTEDQTKILIILKENAKYLNSKNINITNQLNNYINVYRSNEKKLRKDLIQKLKIIKTLKNEKTTNKEKYNKKELSNAKEYILEYIEKDFNKQEFCKEKNISTETLENYLKLLKEDNNPIYDIYIKKTFLNNQTKEQELIQAIPEIIELLKKDNKKEFNLLEYYLITNIPVTRLEELCQIEVKNGNIKQSDYIKYLKRFITENKQIKECSEKDIRVMLSNEKNIVDFQIDKNGNYINRTGRELTLEEKIQLLDFLKENNVPITKKTFHLAIANYNKYLKTRKKLK